MSIFIKEINISKLRHLENIDIILSENIKRNLIITVLKAIKQYLKSIEEKNYTNITVNYKNSIKYHEKRIEEIDNNININPNNLIERQQIDDTIRSLKNSISKYEDGLSLKINDDLNISNKYDEGELILAYFDAKRDSKVIIPQSVSTVELEKKYSIDDDIDRKFLDYLVYLKTQQSFARNEDDMETVESIAKWFNKFENSLKDLFDDNSIKLKFNYRKLNFKIHQDGREEFGLNELSDGFSAVLDIVMNLILRMEKTREGLAYNKEGIVLIDEVETHLHIELQKKIMPFLTSFFPNIQFIVTTHSPFVINSINDAVIYDLEKQIQVEDLSGYSYEGVVEGYFNIDQYSNEAKEKLYRYKELVNKISKSEEDESEEFELRNYFKGIPQNLASEIIYEFKNIEISRLNNK